LEPAPVPGLRRYHLDAPKVGGKADVYAVSFDGWVVTDGSPAVALEVSRQEVFFDSLPIGVPRPDLAEVFPDVPWAATHSGFRSAITSLRLPDEFELHVQVACKDGSRFPLATVRGRCSPVRLPGSDLCPLMITALGRSGTTWLQQLLADHPQIVSYPPFDNDVRVTSYWLDVLLALSEPASYRQALNYESAGDLWWLGRPRRPDFYFSDPDVIGWLGREQVEALGAFCRERIESFYKHLAMHQSMPSARYFLEKRLPSYRRQILALREIFPGTREVFLVRDFRDMLSSVLSFNERLGTPHFGRELTESDESFVRDQLSGSVRELECAWKERADWAHLVRYEDLVLNPSETMHSLLEFLELPAGENDVDRVLEYGSRDGEARQRRHGTTESARKSIGRWRHDLSPNLIGACEESFGDALATFGYER
jgi:hypothetical protein